MQRDVRNAKANYLSDKVEEHKFDVRKLWKDLKNLGYSKKSFCKNPIVLNDNGQLIHDSFTVANFINKFFTTVASVLVSKLPLPMNVYSIDNDSFKNYYASKNIVPDSFKIKSVSEDFIYKELNNLNPHKSIGLDNIGPRFLKDGAEHLKKPVSFIVNLSIETSTVPNELKSARVTALHKKNSKLDVGNYRPISILCSISKILEKSVHCQLVEYLKQNKLLYDYQSGFRFGYSTETCLIWLSDFIREQSSKGLYTGVALLDVQKAFDSVDHAILCKKLSAMGIQPNWFHSYLSDRSQIVVVNNVSSDPMKITCGVPQGSILGPLLYLCYVNDMSICTNQNCKLLLYADDSVLIVTDENPDYVSEQLGKNIESCYNWLVDNKLSMHFGKTECILFGSKRKLKKVKDFKITCKGHVVNSQKSVKYLGTMFDQDMSGTSTVDTIIKKCNSKLKFLYRQADFLNQSARKTLCNALVLCHLEYASTAWYPGLSKNQQNKLQIIQNKCVRYITNAGPRSHVGYIELKNLNYLNVNNRQSQLRLNVMYKIFNGTAPSYLIDNFTTVSSIHSHNTRRSSCSYFQPSVKSSMLNSFLIKGIKDWNSLPIHIKHSSNIDNYKKSVKQLLYDRAKFEVESEYVYY